MGWPVDAPVKGLRRSGELPSSSPLSSTDSTREVQTLDGPGQAGSVNIKRASAPVNDAGPFSLFSPPFFFFSPSGAAIVRADGPAAGDMSNRFV